MNTEAEQYQTLKAAIREANDWLMAFEGINLLYHWPEDEAQEYRAVIKSLLDEK